MTEFDQQSENPTSFNMHFLSASGNEISDWPIYQIMRHANPHTEVFGRKVALKYKSRYWLYFVGWPLRIISGFILANQSLKKLKPNTVVTVHDHILLLAYRCISFFSPKARKLKPKLVLHGYIFTPRHSKLINLLRKHYFRTLFSTLSLIVCHSKYEEQSIQTLLTSPISSVRVVRYGIGEGPVLSRWYEAFIQTPKGDEIEEPVRILAAGRSSRDYQTLADALSHLNADTLKVDIICDDIAVAPPTLENAQITVHNNVYGAKYMQYILDAHIIVVPLLPSNISAGQMVLLHALAAGKPIITTDIITVQEYFSDSPLTRLVEARNPEKLASAITEIKEQLPLSFDQRLSLRKKFESEFSDWAHGRGLLALYREVFG